MRLGFAFIFLAIVSCASTTTLHEESVDLDGDAQPETITLSTTGSGDLRPFRVSVGKATWQGAFFAVDDDLPRMRVVDQRLLVSHAGPSWCRYELLAYRNEQIHHLHTFVSEGCLYEPRFEVDGTIHFPIWWDGFWAREDAYVMSNDVLTITTQPLYDVNVSGTAIEDLILASSSDCAGGSVESGTKLTIVSYEPAGKRYLIRAANGICGWLPTLLMQQVDVPRSG